MSSKISISTFLFSPTGVTTKRRKRVGCCSGLALALAVLGVATPARASTVGCAGASGGPFDFTSLAAAIAASPGGNTVITVSGTCTEAVVIAGVHNLQILGTPGAALVDPGGSPPSFNAVLEIDNSQGVLIDGLSIQAASRPVSTAIPVVLVLFGSRVRFHQCRIEGAGASDGMDVVQSFVQLIGATVIENNNDGQGNGEGVSIRGPSARLTLLRDPARNCPLIQGSGDNGIVAGGGGAHVLIPPFQGCATIQNNGLVGIFAAQGATISLTASQATPGAIQVLNNAIGVIAVDGSHLGISGPVLIQGNTVDGVRLRSGSSGTIFSAPDGTSGPTIQHNASASPAFTPALCCALPAGISVASNAQLDIQAALVANNSAPGVLVQDDSSVRIIGVGPVTITQNPVGVSVTNVSTAALFLAPQISGNVGFDLTCGPDSVAYGDLSAVGKTNCPQFQPRPNPGQPPGGRKAPIP